jgi:hypothetical protein
VGVSKAYSKLKNDQWAHWYRLLAKFIIFCKT